MMTSAKFSQLLAKAASEKKAWKVVRIKLAGKADFADYFVIAEGDTDIQLRAIAENILDQAAEVGEKPLRVDGLEEGTWVLIDFVRVVVHLLLPGERTYYDLEGLWGDRPIMPVG